MTNKNLLQVGKESKEQFKTISQILGSKFKIIAGPCAIESEKDFEIIAASLKKLGVNCLRGGIFKPRSSPYNFQGLGVDALKFVARIAHHYNMLLVSEITDTRYVDIMSQYVDVLQVGARNMQNFELLKEVGKSKRPIILKRGMSATIKEFILAAEYLAFAGSRQIIMCERGIRTFETQTRNTIDIACVPIIKQQTKLPIIVDLSHSLGRKDIMTDVAAAIVALGSDGIMIEVHNTPQLALSDKKQQLNIYEFKNLINHLKNHCNIASF